MVLLLLSKDLSGAQGAISWYAVSLLFTSMADQSAWMVVISVNVAVYFGMGLMTTAVVFSTSVSESMRGFIVVGFLGAQTISNIFALDARTFFTRAGMLAESSCLVASACLFLAGFYAGFLLLRRFMG